jgi:hypothetical protein
VSLSSSPLFGQDPIPSRSGFSASVVFLASIGRLVLMASTNPIPAYFRHPVLSAPSPAARLHFSPIDFRLSVVRLPSFAVRATEFYPRRGCQLPFFLPVPADFCCPDSILRTGSAGSTPVSAATSFSIASRCPTLLQFFRNTV